MEPNKEMLLPLEHITEAAMVSKLVTCMSNQETARRILLDHGGDWEDAKEMAIRDDDAAFVLNRDVANTRWLQPGKLVIVYRTVPTVP